ncbi:MAG TPA: type II secretion protein F [Pasteurella multocida]|nr:type II secretion protein F [Pasteurella multocida]
MKKLKMFRWKGINRLQQIQKGVIVAESKEIAQQSLLLQGVHQLHLQRNWQLSMQSKYTEICDLLMQLAMLLQASVPLKESLQLLQRHASNIELTQWLRQLLCSLESGFSFSTALATQDRYLTKQEYQLISVGESIGKLPLVCAQLAKQRQQSLGLRRKVQKMLFYPMLVLAVTLIFPEMAQQMLHVGEQTGRLSEMLQYIAESYQQTLEHQLDLLSQLLEPCLMLVIGSIIGVILLGMYLPMFNMGALV